MKYYYSHFFDLLFKVFMFCLFFGFIFLFGIIQEELRLNLFLSIMLGISFLGLYILILYKGWCIPTQLYVLTKFGIIVSRLEADYLTYLFSSGNTPGKWYPLNELGNITSEKRKQALFEIAKDIVGYSYERHIEMRKEKKHSKEIKEINNLQRTNLTENNQVSKADEIAKYKKLLDDSAITISEYEKIKKEIIG